MNIIIYSQYCNTICQEKNEQTEKKQTKMIFQIIYSICPGLQGCLESYHVQAQVLVVHRKLSISFKLVMNLFINACIVLLFLSYSLTHFFMYRLYLVFVSYIKQNCDCWNLAVSSHWAKLRDSRDNQIRYKVQSVCGPYNPTAFSYSKTPLWQDVTVHYYMH